MSGVRVKFSEGHAHVGLNFGQLRFITEHTGFDKVSYSDVRFEHGLLQMPTDVLAMLVRQGQETLASLSRNGQIPNCSGALADLGDDTTIGNPK